MREILFRGKRTNNGEWVEGGIIPLDVDSGYVFIAEPYLSASTLPVYEIVKNHTHLVKPETVGQYTGLTDKKGTKIYEGDIISHYVNWLGERVNGVVDYDFGVAGWACRFFHDGENKNGFLADWIVNNGAEIIGNIHDNLELLKGGE